MTTASAAAAVLDALPASRERPAEAYAIDGVAPALAVRPETREELAAALAAASRAGLAVAPQGARSALTLGRPLTRYDVALDTTGLDRIVAYEPDDMTATVEAGVTLGALRERLRAYGQDLPLDPPPDDAVTIGGMLAAAQPGPRRGLLPGMRDLVLGVTVALPDGTLARSGGRVVKNVSGYDLHRLHTGALGAYGVIVEASFKVLPEPPRVETVALHCQHEAQAWALAMSVRDAALPLRALVVLAPAAAQAAGLQRRAQVLVEYGGSEPAVQACRSEVRTQAVLHHATGGEEVDTDTVEALRRLAGAGPVTLRLGVPPAVLPEALTRAAELSPVAWAAPASGAAWLVADALDAGAVAALRRWCVDHGGFLQLEVAPAALRAEVDPFALGERGLVRALKQQFDPQGTINPGRWLEDV